MTRLIDADALIEDLEYDVELNARALDDTDLSLGINREIVQFDKDCKQNAVDMLKKAPTVDAEPVRHGKWIPKMIIIGGRKHFYGMICSVCGEYALEAEGDEFLTDYCYNCGAKMDAERKEK